LPERSGDCEKRPIVKDILQGVFLMTWSLRLWLPGLLIGLLGPSAQGDRPAPGGEFEVGIRPLLASYCFSCHGPNRKKAKIDFSVFQTEKDLGSSQPLWFEVVKQIKSRSMPPEEEEKKPSDLEREHLVTWLETALDRIDEGRPRDPGRVTIRRLNRAEYNNTIRDLTGLDLHPADDFPPDDVSEGFDTLGEVLSVSPLLLERYLDAADRVLDQSMVTEGPVPFLEKKVQATTLAKERLRKDAVDLPLEREIALPLAPPVDGRYLVRIRAWQDNGIDNVAVLSVKLDGVDMLLLRIQATEGKPGDLHRYPPPPRRHENPAIPA
jgi:hypothetical protein